MYTTWRRPTVLAPDDRVRTEVKFYVWKEIESSKPRKAVVHQSRQLAYVLDSQPDSNVLLLTSLEFKKAPVKPL